MRLRAAFFVFTSFFLLSSFVVNVPQALAQTFGTQSITTRSVDGGTVPKSQTPTFDWSAITGATSYTLEICKGEFSATGVCTAGLAIPAATLIPTNSYTPTVELPRKVVLYWHVRAVSTVYGLGPWSASSNFLSANSPPKPVASLPAATIVQNTSPTIVWSTTITTTTPPISTYEIQFCTIATCAAGSVVSTTTDAGDTYTGSTATLIKKSWQVTPALQNAAQYYWRVRSKGSNGDASGWSATLGLKTLVAATNVSGPADGVDLNTTTPTFSWSAVTNAGTYAVLVSKNGINGTYTAVTGATALANTITSFTPTLDIGKPTAPETRLYWKVRTTTTAYGLSDSAVRSMIPAAAPTPAVLTQFTVAQQTRTPLFKWTSQKATAAIEPTGYDLQLATDAAFTQGVINKSITRSTTCPTTGTATLYTYTCSYTIDQNLATGTTYYWRVRSKASSGDTSAWVANGATTPLKIALINPPSLTSPANGSTVDNANPTFTWNAVNGALNYTIQFCKVAFSATSTCASLALPTATVTTNSYTPTAAFPLATTVYWNVKANSTLYLNTLYSSASTFISAGPPNPPVLVAFAGAQQVRPLFKWTSTKLATTIQPNAYELQLATDSGFTQGIITKQLNRSSVCTQAGTPTITYTCNYTIDQDLENGTTYYWRVRSETGTASTDDSSIWVANVAASPLKIILEKPSLVSPVSGEDVDSTLPTFTFNTVKGITVNTGYVVKKLVSTTWTAVAGTVTLNGATATFKPTAAVVTTPLGGDVSWQVVATSTLYGTATSNTGVFTSAAAPTAPVLTAFSATAQTTLRPTFKWYSTKTTATLDPVTYELQLAKDTAFTQGVITKTLTRAQAGCVQSGTTASLKFTCAYVIDQNLTAATSYHWRVRAVASTGDASVWVANAPTTPLKIGIIDAPNTGTPTVVAALSATPTTIAVGESVTLTPSVTGTATGTVTYEYRCKATDAFSAATSSTTSTCTYATAGSYVASVRATRQGITDIADSTTITVTTAPTAPPIVIVPPPADAKVVNVLLLRYNTETYTAADETLFDATAIKNEQSLENASRFHGYSNATAKPTINVVVKGEIKRTGGGPIAANSYAAFDQMMNAEVCDYIVNNKIDQVWLYFGSGSAGTYDQEFSWVNKYESSTCGSRRSFVSLTSNDGRGDYGINNNTLHVFGHFMEQFLGYLQHPDLFENRWRGTRSQDFSGKYGYVTVPPYNQILCGDVHFPPYSTSIDDDYDYNLSKTAPNNGCENWTPTNSGAKTTITSRSWKCEPTDNTTTYDPSCPDNQYYWWWFNNMPTKGNAFTYQGMKIPGWFEFLGDMDATMEYYGRRSEWWMNRPWLNLLSPKLTEPYYMNSNTSQNVTNGTEVSGSFVTSTNHVLTAKSTNPILMVAVTYRTRDSIGALNTPNGIQFKSGTTTLNLTRLRREVSPGHEYASEMWYLPQASNPASELTGKFTVTFTAPIDSIRVNAYTFAGISQTAVPVAQGTAVNPPVWSGSDTHTLTVPSAVGDYVFAVHGAYAETGLSPLGDYEYTNTETFANIVQSVALKIATSTSTAMQWNVATKYPWNVIGVALKKAP